MTLTRSFRRPPSPLLLAALLALLIAAVYWPAATFDFVRWDDQINLTQNPLMNPPSVKHAEVFWRRPYAGLYIPVTYSAWSAVASVGHTEDAKGGSELNPYLFHCMNIFTHFLVALVVWRLLLRLVRDTWAAWFGAAFFALHPTCVEAVAWVTGFRDVLGGLLGFAALLAYFPPKNSSDKVEPDRPRPDPKPQRDVARYALSCILFLLAILAKPAAVAVLPMALVLDLLWFHRRIKIIIARLIPWTVAAGALAWMTHHIQGLPSALDTPPWWQRPLIAGDALTFYLGKLLLPIRLCVQYDHSPHRVLGRAMAIKPTTIALLVAIAIYFLGKRWRWTWISAALFAAGLLPVLGFAPFGFQYFSTTADRYMYFALLGGSAAVAFILASKNQSQNPAPTVAWASRPCPAILNIVETPVLLASETPSNPRAMLYYPAIALLCICGVLSFHQVLTWQTTPAIFQHVLEINPHSNLALVKLSFEKLRDGDPQSAEQLARRALTVRPDDARAWINLGAALEELHHPAQARDCYQHVVQTDFSRDSAGAFSNLAAMRADSGDYSGAIILYKQALQRDPDLLEAQIGLAAARARITTKPAR